MKWFTGTPIGILRAYARRLLPLQSEASFLAMQRVAMGSGSLSKEGAKELAATWRQHLPRRARKAAKASTADLLALGIGVRPVTAKA